MKVLTFLMSKGGTGKTSLADEVAFSLEGRGYSVVIRDLDPQQGTYFKREHENPDITIVDTRGSVDTGLSDEFVAMAEEVVEFSTHVLIPTLLDRDSEEPLEKMVKIVTRVGRPFKILPNKVDFRRQLDRNKFAKFCKLYPQNMANATIRSGAVVGHARDCLTGWDDINKSANASEDMHDFIDELIEWLEL